jgi:hypothetical protein
MRLALAWMSIFVTLSLVACGGDDNADTPDAPPGPPDAPDTACAPTPPALQPGPLADPRLLGLPTTCVPGGLRDLPGRWFVRNPDSSFQFQYPRYEGDCTNGFRRANVGDDDVDITDGQIFHNWSDGTIVATRTYFRFPETGDPEFEYVSTVAACMQSDGNLAVVRGYYDTDTGELMSPWIGTPFGVRDAPAQGLELVGELGTALGGLDLIAYNVVVDGTTAYTVGPLGLEIIDVSDPAAPVAIGHVDGAFNDVKVVRGPGATRVAFAAPLYNEGTHVIDVTVPTAPVEQALIDQYSHSVFVRQEGAQQLLYLATYSAEIPVYDVTTPLVPVLLDSATVPGEFGDGVHDLFATADMIYANSTTAGMVAIDVSAGLDQGVEAGRIQTSYSHASWVGTAGGRAVVLHGDEGMTGGADGGAFLRVLEGDPAAGTFVNTELARYQSRREVGMHNFMLVGNKVYIAYYHDGVRVVDLSTPTAPVEVAHYNTWDDQTAPGGAFEAALGIRVVGGLIYVADSLRGLIILREI